MRWRWHLVVAGAYRCVRLSAEFTTTRRDGGRWLDGDMYRGWCGGRSGLDLPVESSTSGNECDVWLRLLRKRAVVLGTRLVHDILNILNTTPPTKVSSILHRN
jgi:hypothetical protein